MIVMVMMIITTTTPAMIARDVWLDVESVVVMLLPLIVSDLHSSSLGDEI